MEVKNEPCQYQWIVNEGLLRDEGTLFGMAGAAIREKVEAIRNYYRTRKATTLAKRDGLVKEIEGMDDDPSKKPQANQEPAPGPVNFIPTIFQLLLYAGSCYFNFYLIMYWLSPAFHSIFICLGLYLFGLFSVFMGRSIMYNTARSLTGEKTADAQRENWKIYFEEFGVPLVVSLFIAILPSNTYSLLFSIIATLLFFLLFLLGGKGLVNTFFRARTEFGRYIQRNQKRREQKARSRKMQALKEDLISTVAALEELNAEEDYKINILTSEYNLALESRQLNDNPSVKKLA
jgi:hypothetical protein